MTTPEVLIFDLFGTLVFFDDARVPMMDLAGRRVPMTVTGLPQMLAELEPRIALETFLAELRRVSQAVADEKRAAGIEIATPVRFERTLRSLGVAPVLAATVAVRMARLHMDTLARSVVCPAGRPELLAGLAGRYRLALLSNFDDGTTARRVLEEARLTPYFDTIVISEEEGIRKPVREIFERTCLKLGARPADCLYIGDTLVEDIHGAHQAGLSPIWIRAEAASDAGEPTPAIAVLPDVDALPEWLERAAG